MTLKKHLLFNLFKFITWLCCVCILLASFQLRAQEPTFVHLSEKQNLPDKTFYNITEDKKGFIWLSAKKGLFRYDGKNYENFTHPKQRGTSIFGTKQTQDGKIWCNNITGQFFYVDNGKMHFFIDLSKQLKGELSDFEVFNQDLWVFSTKSLYKINLKTKQISNININKKSFLGTPIQYQKKLYYKNRDNIEFIDHTTTEKTLIHRQVAFKNNKGNVILKGKSKPFIFDNKLCYLERLNNESRFFYTDKNTQEIKEFKGLEAISKERIYNQFAQKSELWISTNSGVWVYQISSNKASLKKRFLTKYHITKIIKDKESNYWLTTLYNGVFVIPNIFIEKESISIEDKNIMCIEKVNDSIVFFGTDKGRIIQYNLYTKKQKATQLTTKYRVQYLKYYPKKKQLFISADDVGFQYNLETQKLQKHPYFSNVKTAQIINNQNVLYANHDRVRLLRHNNIKKDTILFSGKRTYTTHYDSVKKQVYIAFVDNLVKCDSLWNTKIITHQNKSIYARSISETSDGIIWVTTFKNGIYGLKNDVVIQHFSTEMLGSKDIRKIVSDGEKLWVVLGNSVKVLSPKKQEIKTLTKADGIVSYDISGIVFSKNKVYFSSNEGLFSLKKNKGFKKQTPNLYFNSFQINEKDTLIKKNYVLKHNENTLKIGFNVNGFSYNQRANYRYRLKGLQKDWFSTDIGENYIKYNNLPSGDYTFEVQTTLKNDAKNDQKSLRFTIQKPFWWRWWFIALCIGFLVGSIVLYYRQKIKRKEKERLRELEKISLEKELININLTALRSQMNPHFIFNALNSIQDLVLRQDTEASYDYIVLFARLIRNTLSYSNQDFIPVEEELDFLRVYLQLEKLRFGDEFTYEIAFNSSESLEVPSLLIQPFIENALIHGLMHKLGDKKLSVLFSFKDELLICEITDNGIGREKSSEIRARQGNHHKSFALQAIEKRLEILQKQLDTKIGYQIIDLYENEQATGTKVIVKVPYRYRF